MPQLKKSAFLRVAKTLVYRAGALGKMGAVEASIAKNAPVVAKRAVPVNVFSPHVNQENVVTTDVGAHAGCALKTRTPSVAEAFANARLTPAHD